jgi:hypothetical protein
MPSLLHPTIKHGQIEFHHMFAPLTSLIDPGQGPRHLVPGTWSNVTGGFLQRISIARSVPREAAVIGAWYKGKWPQEHMRACQYVLECGIHPITA